MDRAKWPALSGLIIGTVAVTRTVQTTFAFDKTIHSSFATLACCGTAVIGVSRWLPRDAPRTHKGELYEALPLAEVGQPHASREPSPQPGDIAYPSSLRKLRILFLALVLALCARIGILREVVRNVQCSATSWAPLIPIAFAAWDFWSLRRGRSRATTTDDDDVEASVYDALQQFVVRLPYAVFIVVCLICFGGLFALRLTSSPPSTFICAASLPYRWSIPDLQRLGSALDVFIVLFIYQILTLQDRARSRSLALRFASVGWSLLFSAIFILLFGIVYYFVQDRDRRWILTIPSVYVWDVLKLDLYITITMLCALTALLHVGLLTTSLIAIFTTVTTIATSAVWGNGHPFPPLAISSASASICVALFAFIVYVHLDSAQNGTSTTSPQPLFRKISPFFYLGMAVLFFVWVGIWASYHNEDHFHPVDMLIFEAQTHHEAYANQSAGSKSLHEAVEIYKARYSRLPPPGFDQWYKYATTRDSSVIDDFDSIHRDVLPFHALSPGEIRDRTSELISNPWNDAAGVIIRDGKVSIASNVVPTHKWMLDGLVEMIGKFAESLPDMDLAFNLNDECRVSVPYEQIEPMRQAGMTFSNSQEHSAPGLQRAFSQNRAEQWKPVPEEPNPRAPLQELSWQQTFHRFGNNGCPPNSPARTQRLWDHSQLCLSCIHPQSLGAFMSNWTTAANICHQPDLADLHGIYLSPAAFKGTHELYPIFSQSKVHGFNDILYPSAWNYLEKAKYAPTDEFPDRPFPEKENTLFWRGATSEGVSHDMEQWRGMTRQRFVHMTNNINGSTPPQPLLLPALEDDGDGPLQYQDFPISKLTELLPTDVKIVNEILRCAGHDCGHQHKEFSPLAPPTDFQHHWQYKYLLDLDGAGFSGRFLPFLQSRSLPFKAGLFREWWDDRVTPWLHFVPLDIRGHGLWATLAYFHGLDGVLEGEAGKAGALEVKIDAHARNAERIAEQGREWAGKVLRKEDMEIYFFRLLLEWGRVTDDRREELGFTTAA